MFGSIFYNCWAALFSFAVYFIWAIKDPYASPWSTIGASFVAAIIGFIVMYILRYFMGYIFYTPEGIVFSDTVNGQDDVETVNGNQNLIVPQNERTTVDFEEENTEDIAKVVRTMLHGQDEAISR